MNHCNFNPADVCMIRNKNFNTKQNQKRIEDYLEAIGVSLNFLDEN